MNPDKEKQFGKGRGSIFLKLLKEKEKSESAAQSRSIVEQSSSIEESEQQNQVLQSHVPTLTEIPTTGHGRASLLSKVKAMRFAEAQSPKPIQVASQGRGALISKLKASLAEQPSVALQPCIDAGVLGTLSEYAIQEGTSSSELSRPIKPKLRQGTSGSPIQLSGNYITLKLSPGKGLFNYEVKFIPDIDSRPLRRKLLNQHLETFGRTRVFDGVTLFLPQKLQKDITTLESIHPMDQSKVELKVIYKKQQTMSENIPFFNILLGRVLRALSLVRIGQNNFNPKGIQAVPQHKLEVWPGYVTAISEYEGGLKLCIDTRHRIMRTETIRDIMVKFGGKSNFKDSILKELIGLSVFTRYNNKTYRVDDIAWDKNPTYEFEKGTEKISILDYYKYHWNLEIKDMNQPLLVHCENFKSSTGETQEKIILLVPELCYLASLSESVRTDFRIMKDLMTLTQMTPNARRDVIRHFITEVQNNNVPREILAEWGLQLESDVTEFTGRMFEPECIIFGNNARFTSSTERGADWSSAVTRNTPLRIPNLNHWYVLYCQKDTRCTQEFVGMLKNVSKVIGMSIKEPHLVCLKDDRIETYVQALRKNIQQTVNLMVIVFPTNRTDRYSTIKRICCVEMPVPSQVIMSRTISRGDRLKSITEKIALQINCKLGGALWALNIPMDNCMICGIDVYHAGAGQSMKGSVAGFVASLDKALTTWHNKVCIQGKRQEIVDMLQMCLISAIRAYYKHNKRYPDRIIIYRDGVGDGQLEVVLKYEIKQLLVTFKTVQENYEPTLTVIIVQKRINTRIFERSGMGVKNPPSGTIVDSCITKSDIYDFFLVSQNIRQGTVSPTRYIVIYDNKNMKPEHIQRLTYKLCHLYYNWAGTIKIPAPCQYAHKLVSLVGQNIQQEPHQSLADTLYYL
ncbi:piwi-like protein Ago3 isoform X2 [Frieseomelitta varia]|uniref:piwi-like protein Ago3 isoform X2 n=1 Tax=Frieseomelitta varia TaxID=561572 RepID=UPI001CB68C01|nr:piwi-like protein Ago3 isoform X2 [Frieseomelitta varia]